MAMWWVEAGHTPTLSDAKGKLALIEQLGACPEAFHVKHLFDPNGNTITYER